MLRKLIVALIAAGSLTAHALVWTDGNLTVTLHGRGCEHLNLMMALSEITTEASAATVIIRDQAIPACYGEKDGKVYLVDMLGNAGYIPLADFK